MRAVSVGGGTGQPATLRALRRLDCDITAIVAMADDGGSTGILRRELGVIPPGDVRNCLVALAADPTGPLARSFQRRLETAGNHALGNLLIAVLAQESSFIEAIDQCERMLGCVGEVMPSTLENVKVWGLTRDGREIDGEHMIENGPCTLSHAWLEPMRAKAYKPAVQAILDADLVVMGPGSLYTSIIPNLLVPEIVAAIRTTRATRVFVCPKADTQGETWGLAADEYVGALYDHGLTGAIDAVLVHRRRTRDGVATRAFKSLTPEEVTSDAARRHLLEIADRGTVKPAVAEIRAVSAGPEVIARLQGMVPTVVVRDFEKNNAPTGHDDAKLADALRGVASCRSPRR